MTVKELMKHLNELLLSDSAGGADCMIIVSAGDAESYGIVGVGYDQGSYYIQVGDEL